MKTVILYGDLRKKFGKEFRLNVNTPGEAIRALSRMVKGFQQYFIDHNEPGFHVKVGREYIDKKEINDPGDDVIRIIPYVAGSKKAFKIILGIALIAVAIYAVGLATTIGPSSWGLTGMDLLKFGISTVLQGIAEVLFSPPKPPDAISREEAKPSYAFDGPVNTVQQGNPVPLCYGKLIVGSQVISAITMAGSQ